MLSTSSGRRVGAAAASVVGLLAPVALAAPALAETEQSYFFEETAEAFWGVPHTCADGSVVPATLLVRSTRDFEAPDTEDADPTARVQYLAVCPGGLSFSWAASAAPATITSTENLKSVHAVGSGIARDNVGGTHQVSFDVTYLAYRYYREVRPDLAPGVYERTIAGGPGGAVDTTVYDYPSDAPYFGVVYRRASTPMSLRASR